MSENSQQYKGQSGDARESVQSSRQESEYKAADTYSTENKLSKMSEEKENYKGIDKKTKAQVVRFIRLLFRRSEQFKEARERAVHPDIKGPRGGKMWQCCKCKEAFKATEIQVDHIEPIVPNGIKQADMTIDEYVARLFCSVDNLQCLCDECHKEKTFEERGKKYIR